MPLTSHIQATLFGIASIIGLTIAGCNAPIQNKNEQFVRPLGFPNIRIPEENPMTVEKVELGRFLFYDTRLSFNQSQSCASCHKQELAFTDGRAQAVGSTGETHPRSSQSLTNVAYNATLTWANPLVTKLESQIQLPLFGDNPIEMESFRESANILGRVATDPNYMDLFDEAFPENNDPISWQNITAALACFNRTLISGNSPFDKFVYQNDSNALSTSQKRGMELFYSERLECVHCHGGFNFTASSVHADSVSDAALFHNTGLYNIDQNGAYPANNTGVFEITGNPEDMGRFRAPTLRNIEVTAPYMHDGSIRTLEEVIRFYEAGGRIIQNGPYAGNGKTSPLKSGFVSGFSLTNDERSDLINFLHSLTDTEFLQDPRFSNPF